MNENQETVLAADVAKPEFHDRARAALRVLNPHVYYSPKGDYEPKLIVPDGHWITVELAVKSWGWEGAERIPDVRNLLDKMNLVLQISQETV